MKKLLIFSLSFAIDLSIFYRYLYHINNVYLKNLHLLYLIFLWIMFFLSILVILFAAYATSHPDIITIKKDSKNPFSYFAINKITAYKIIDVLICLAFGITGIWNFFIVNLLHFLGLLITQHLFKNLYEQLKVLHPELEIEEKSKIKKISKLSFLTKDNYGRRPRSSRNS
jgi:hypothetical protein